MVYTIITVFLFILGIITFIPRFKRVINSNQLGINFFLTLIATLIGVLLAISITNYENKQKEKTDVIKLINAGSSSVKIVLEYSEALITYFDTLPNDNNLRDTFYDNNPIPYPDFLSTFLTQTIVYRNLSEPTLLYLNTLLINLKKSHSTHPALYVALLKQAEEVLKAETDFQKGNLTEQQISQKLAQLQTLISDAQLKNTVIEVKAATVD